MYKYFHFALIFSVSLFVNAAYAATGLTELLYDYGTLNARTTMSFSDADSSDYDFWLPVGGTKKYYKYNHSTPDESYTTYDSRVNISGKGSHRYGKIYIANQNYSGSGAAVYARGTNTVHVGGDFVNNVSSSYGGAVYVDIPYDSSTWSAFYLGGGAEGAEATNFVNNTGTYGGGLYLSTSITSKPSGSYPADTNNLFTAQSHFVDFYGNTGTYGGGMYVGGRNFYFDTSYGLGPFTGNFISNNASYDGGAVYYAANNYYTGKAYSPYFHGDFISNSAGRYGGAIYNSSKIDGVGPYGDQYTSIEGNFIGNTAVTAGGAIYNTGTIENIANTTFYGNMANGVYNDIHNTGTIGLNTPAGTSVTFGGSITGTGTINVNNGGTADSGQYIFNSPVSNNRFNLYNGGTAKFGSILQLNNTTTYGSLSASYFTNDANSGTLDFRNSHLDANTLGAVTLASDLYLQIDVDLANALSDTLEATSKSGTGKFVLDAINLTSTSSATGVLIPVSSTLKNAISLASDITFTGVSNPYNRLVYDSGYLVFGDAVVPDTPNLVHHKYGHLESVRENVTFTQGTEGDHDFVLPMADGSIKYFKYGYTVPSGYSRGTAAFDTGNVTNKYYTDGDYLWVNGESSSRTSVGNLTLDAYSTNSGYGFMGLSPGYNSGRSLTVNAITAAFVNNTTTGSGRSTLMFWGQNIYGLPVTIKSLVADFVHNSNPNGSGGAMLNLQMRGTTTINSMIANFIANSASGNGGAIESQGSDVAINIDRLTGSFISNSAGGVGGAIHHTSGGTITLLADDRDILFYGNTDSTGYNDIDNSGTINMNAASPYPIVFGGSITGSNGILNLNNDASAANRGGTYIFNNTVSGNSFNLYNFGQFC
ncbi:MAG: hypothetical protein IJS26_06585 [Alphaproteobacteria bacterium]|nr:hypothetical protein [Alphaproteobacteria bacterium]